MLEKIRVAAHLECNYLPMQNQWGFLPRKSTTSAILSATEEWFTLLEEGKEVGTVFFVFHWKISVGGGLYTSLLCSIIPLVSLLFAILVSLHPATFLIIFEAFDSVSHRQLIAKEYKSLEIH